MEWTADLLKAMARSKQAQDDYDKMPLAAWCAKYLLAGDHCKFCRSAGTCPAIEQRATDAAGVWFNDLDQPQFSNAPSTMSPEELSKKLDLLDLIQEWMNAVRHHATDVAQSGVEIPEYQLSETIGHRKWKEEEDKVREHLFLKADLTDDQVFNKKLKSPAQVEKVLGAKRKAIVDTMTHRPVTGVSLVRKTKTTRPAVPAAVNKHFAPIED
jgi:hypothetical protein